MPYVAPPRTYRTGLFQLRPALLGWQWRSRPYGQSWGPWGFRFGREANVRAVVQAQLGEGFVEIPVDEEEA